MVRDGRVEGGSEDKAMRVPYLSAKEKNMPYALEGKVTGTRTID